MSWATVAVTAGTMIVGGIQKASAKKKAKRAEAASQALAGQRKAFQTPKELLDVVGMSQNAAQQGYSPQTLDYLTSQSNRATSGALNTAKLLGANPNQLSGILDQDFQNIFAIGSGNEQQKMKNFDRFLNSVQTLSGSREGEWLSKENILKDKMQLQFARGEAARAEDQSANNLLLQGLSTAGSAALYGNLGPNPPGTGRWNAGNVGGGAAYGNRVGLADTTPAANVNPGLAVGNTVVPGTNPIAVVNPVVTARNRPPGT